TAPPETPTRPDGPTPDPARQDAPRTARPSRHHPPADGTRPSYLAYAASREAVRNCTARHDRTCIGPGRHFDHLRPWLFSDSFVAVPARRDILSAGPGCGGVGREGVPMIVGVSPVSRGRKTGKSRAGSSRQGSGRLVEGRSPGENSRLAGRRRSALDVLAGPA